MTITSASKAEMRAISTTVKHQLRTMAQRYSPHDNLRLANSVSEVVVVP